MNTIGASFSDGIFDDGYMWVFDNLIQAVCRIDLEKEEMEILSYYNGEERFVAERIFLFRERFYFVTKLSTKILIYERKRQEEKAFSLCESTDITPWTEVFAYAGCIYFLCINGELVRFEISTEQYTQKELLTSSEKEEMGISNSFVRRPWVHDKTVWIALYGSNRYLQYDVTGEKADLFHVEDKDAALDRICFDGERVWLTELKQKDIICQEKGAVRIPMEQVCSKLCDSSRWILAFPKQGNQFILIEKETNQTLQIDLPFFKKENQKMGNCREYKDCLFLFQSDVRELYVLQKETWKFKRVSLKCDYYQADRYFTTEKEQLLEDKYMGLEQMLQFCAQNDACAKQSNNTVGKTIWNTVIGE